VYNGLISTESGFKINNVDMAEQVSLSKLMALLCTDDGYAKAGNMPLMPLVPLSIERGSYKFDGRP